MSSGSVQALVLTRDRTAARETVAALQGQTRPPDEVLTARRVGPVAAGAGTPLPPAATAWIWLVDSHVAPEPDALERLFDALERAASLADPVLLAGKVVTPDGAPEPRALPVPAVFDPELAVSAFERRLVQLRACRTGSLLIRRSALGAAHLPRDGGLEWTARLLRQGPGFLEPTSVAVRHPDSDGEERARGRARLRDSLRLLAGSSLEGYEKPWFAFRLAEDALETLKPAR